MNYPKENKLDFIAVLVGGSHLYGLNTAESDLDFRAVYRTDNLAAAMGLTRDDGTSETKEEGDDYAYFELSRFLQLLRKTNTNSMEILFAPDDAFLHCEHSFSVLRKKHAEKLVDSKRFMQSCKGYVFSESRLALGERTGKLGGKRKAALDRFGYSPKNVVQILRIVATSKHFLETGFYPIKLKEIDLELWNLCMSIKQTPENFSLDKIQRLVQSANTEIEQAQDKVNMSFDLDFAARFAFDQYKQKFILPAS